MNTVLHDELPSPIQTLTYQNPEFITHAERQYLNLIKHSVVDVFVITEDGTRAFVEIQKGTDQTDLIRFLDYQCRNFSHQFQVGDDYSHPVPCYSICWLFDITPPHHNFQEKLTIHSNETTTNWRVAWEMIAIYPNCIRPDHLQHKTFDKVEEWLLLDVVQDARKAEDIKQMIQTTEIKEAFEQLDLSGLTEAEIEELEFQSAITDRYKRPFAKSIQQAEAKAEKEKAIKIAKNLLDVLDIDIICQKTGLSRKEVEQLQ